MKNKELDIDHHVLILGSFKEQDVQKIQRYQSIELFEEYDLIKLRKFLSLIDNDISSRDTMDSTLVLANFFMKFRDISYLCSTKANKFHELLISLKNIIRFHILSDKKGVLIEELKLSEKKKQYSDISAKMDLISKLNESLEQNTKRLKYLEEDYLNQLNQMEQVNERIKDYNSKIQELDARKKECFRIINQLTREMESGNTDREKKSVFFSELIEDKNLPKSKKIRILQQQARESQGEISKVREKLNEAKLKHEEIRPGFEIVKKDYNTLREMVEKDNSKMKMLKSDLNINLKLKNGESLSKDAISSLNQIRDAQIIQDEIEQINIALEESKLDDDKLNDSHSFLSNLKDQLTNLNSELNGRNDELVLTWDLSEIRKSFQALRETEECLKRIEKLCNLFLNIINVSFSFQFEINQELNEFYIRFNYERNDKEKLTFRELTTPEKVFFVISFYISLNIIMNNHCIIFSNLFLPQAFNKRGSVFRTIRKIVPIFIQESELEQYLLIFIISNLILKKPIKIIPIINIEKSEENESKQSK